MDERSRKREDDWFLQNEKKLLEDARKSREKRDGVERVALPPGDRRVGERSNGEEEQGPDEK